MIGEILLNNGIYSLNNCQYPIRLENINILPNDVIEYNIINNALEIVRIVYRKQIVTVAIINEWGKFYLPIYNSTFDNNLLRNLDHNMRVIMKIDIHWIEIIKEYDAVSNRQSDEQIIKDLFIYINNAYIIPSLRPTYYKSLLDSYQNINNEDQTSLYTFTINDSGIGHDNAISIQDHFIYVHTIDICKYVDFLSLLGTTNRLFSYVKSRTMNFISSSQNDILFDDEIRNKCVLIKDQKRHVITVEINTRTNQISDPYRSIIMVKNHYTYESILDQSDSLNCLKEYVNNNMVWSESCLPIRHINVDENGNMINAKLIPVDIEDNTFFNTKIVETLLFKMNIRVTDFILNNKYDQSLKYDIPIKVRKTIKLTNIRNKHILTLSESLINIYKPSKTSNLSKQTYVTCTSPLDKYYDVIIQQLLYGIRYDNLDGILQYLYNKENMYDVVMELYNSWKIDDYIENYKVSIQYIKELDMYYIPQLTYKLNRYDPLHRYIIARDF